MLLALAPYIAHDASHCTCPQSVIRFTMPQILHGSSPMPVSREETPPLSSSLKRKVNVTETQRGSKV